MLTLPKEIRGTMLKSFWTVACSIAICITILILYYITNTLFSLLLLLFIPVISFYDFSNHKIFTDIYVFTNRILVKINSIINNLLISIIYYILFFTYKITNSKVYPVIRMHTQKTMWELTTILYVTEQDKMHEFSIDGTQSSSWLKAFLKWIKNTKKWWLLSVVPFIFIISLITNSKDVKRISHDTYTLF